ncbi:phosphate acyltransferase PlsX [bacterium]|nr:phosphate acyltransferase PlsX [bacterium]
MPKQMRIALDAMGGDESATPLVEGAVWAVKRFDCEVILVGKKHSMQRLLRYFRYKGDAIRIAPCSQVVSMKDSPRDSLQKRDSSISVAVRMVAQGEADAVVSAGNTGATLAHCMRGWGRLKGIKRPGIAPLIPTQYNPVLVIDGGANVDCKPLHLVDFAIMGSIYSNQVLGLANPRIGILSNGQESSKGNALTLATYELLEKSHLNFVGNVEASHLFNGKVEVVVCDGFVGNVFLKTTETVAKMIIHGVKGAMTQNVISMAGAVMISPGMRKFRRKVDQAEYGGAPLLGLEHTCIIAHGSSSPKAVMNAIRVAKESVEQNINKRISEEVRAISQELKED